MPGAAAISAVPAHSHISTHCVLQFPASRAYFAQEETVDYAPTNNTYTATSRDWQDVADEAVLDHLTANSISILAYSEFEQNGGSDYGAAVP
jgi:hypothetical protein